MAPISLRIRAEALNMWRGLWGQPQAPLTQCPLLWLTFAHSLLVALPSPSLLGGIAEDLCELLYKEVYLNNSFFSTSFC